MWMMSDSPSEPPGRPAAEETAVDAAFDAAALRRVLLAAVADVRSGIRDAYRLSHGDAQLLALAVAKAALDDELTALRAEVLATGDPPARLDAIIDSGRAALLLADAGLPVIPEGSEDRARRHAEIAVWMRARADQAHAQLRASRGSAIGDDWLEEDPVDKREDGLG